MIEVYGEEAEDRSQSWDHAVFPSGEGAKFLVLTFMLGPHVENVTILVDDRERPSGIAEELEKLSGVLVRIEHLAVGDYNIDGAVLVERKECEGFRSIIDGRSPVQSSQADGRLAGADSLHS